MDFDFRGVDESGVVVRGVVDARDPFEAERKVRAMGLSSIEVAVVRSTPGFSSTPAPVPRQVAHTETRSDKGTGVAAGCAAGGFTGSILIGLGVLLCFTGIGAIIGVVMIIVGVIMFFAGPFAGLTSIRGRCPYCGSDVHATKVDPGVTCPACQRRIVIREGKYFRVD